MQWIAPAERDAENAALEKRLWDAAGLKQSENSERILGFIFSLSCGLFGGFVSEYIKIPPQSSPPTV